MAMKLEPGEDDVENAEDPFESVWVKAETVIVTPDYININDNADADAKTVAEKNPLHQTKKSSNLKTRKCTICDFSTIYGNSLKYHMLTHTEERPYSCEYCDFKSKYPPILKRHINTLHGALVMTNVEPELLTCKQCSYTTTIKQNLKGHIRKHKKDKQFKCADCSFETAYRHNFVKHTKTHQLDVYRCDKCTFETKFHGHITRHMEQIHNEVIQESKHICEYCQTTSREKWKLKRHKERSIMKQAMRCVFCSFETIYKCQMRKHKRMHDNDNAECSFVLAAAAATVTEDDINKFIQTDPSETLYKCDKCTFETKYKGHMTRHLETIHNEIVESGFKCEICSATFTEKYKLRQHMTKSVVKYPVKCTECNFETLYKCELRRHKKIEHFEDKERYESREPSFPKPAGRLQRTLSGQRVRIEDNVDGIICDKCPFKTMNEAAMTKHSIEVHNLCKLCNHFFTDKWSLNVHIIKSKAEDVIKCAYCDFGSLYRCETNTHANSHFTELCGPKEDRTSNTDEINLLNYYKHDSHLSKMITDTQQGVAPYYRQIEAPSAAQSELYEDNSESIDNNQLGQSKFGTYLIDQNCIDWRTIQVIETNDSINRYKCPLCDFPSKFKACVQRHFQRHHTDSRNRPYKCVNCSFSTKTKDAIALHSKRNPSGALLHCQICDYTTSYKCAYNSHTKFHYANKCKICKSIYKHKHELIRHVATKHLGKGIKCQLCDFIALRKDSMASHILTHTGVKPFPCSLCDFGTVRRTLLDVHMRKKHGVVERVGVKIIDKSKIDSLKVPSTEVKKRSIELKKHEVNLTAANNNFTEPDGIVERDDVIDQEDVMDQDDVIRQEDDDPIKEVYSPAFQEEYCQSVDMLSEDALDVKPDINLISIDIEVEVPGPDTFRASTEFLPIPTMEAEEEYEQGFSETFACDQCDYTSPVMRKLAAHISRKHDTSKKFKCILCPFRTPKKELLVKHKEMHKKKTAYKCSICSFKSKSKEFIIKHLWGVHNKKVRTEHVCVYCNRSMVSKNMLALHLKRYYTQKAIVCPMCNFETIYSCQMKKHRLSHLLEERDEKDDFLTKPKAAMYTKVKVKKIKTDSDESDASSDSSEENTFKCEKCPFESINEKNMLKHLVRAHNGCKHCSRAFSSKAELGEHIKHSKSDDVVKCFFCDFDSDYKCVTCKHMCTHFIIFNGVQEDGNIHLEDKIATLMSSIEARLKTTGTTNECIKNDENEGSTENVDQDHSNLLQLEENQFGNFLVDPTHIDSRSLSLEKTAQADAYQCPACEFSTKYRTSMQRHIQRNHAKNHQRPYRCIDCGFSAKSKDAVRKHNQRKVSRKILTCSQCNFTATVKCALAVHRKRHFKLNCKACGKVFSYKNALIAHFAVTHLMIGLKCRYCDFYASLKENIVDHESTHTGLKAYQCSICDYSANRKRVIQEHFRRYHWHGNFGNKKIKPFKEKKVEVKIEDTSPGEVVSCDLCSYTITSKAKLAMHIKRKHSTMFMCEKCPYTTPYKGALKAHSRTHTKYSLFKCTKCPYETSFKGRIISHLEKVHSLKMEDKDAKLICEFCNEKQRSYYMLKIHEETGRYDEPTKCASCDFEAIYKCQMVKHENVHSADYKTEPTAESRQQKLYTEEVITENVLKCRFCSFVGSRRGTITRHEATHANEKPFKCNMCGFSSKTNLLLMTHWKKHHGYGNKN